MAAADKARFYLERSVPDLQELSRKGIFNDAEITAIVKKRSDFEHILNSQGSKPSDYVRYTAYEMNVDSLRKKRAARLRIKHTMYNGQKTVLAIFDRATKKFPGDRALWIQYIQFCAKEKANKRLAKVFTAVLRLRPRDWTIWIIAAKHYAETQGDMATARAYLQRALRFCKNESRLYIEYARMEMVYLAKLAARRRILGLDEEPVEKAAEEGEEDMIALPDITMEDLEPSASRGVEHIDQAALQRLSEAPLLRGEIPITIFDAAMKQFNNDLALAAEFFDLAVGFDDVPAMIRIRAHILLWLQTNAPESAEAIICEASESLTENDALSPEFPASLGSALAIVRSVSSHERTEHSNTRLQELLIFLLLPYMRVADLDDDVRQVIHASIHRALKNLKTASSKRSSADDIRDGLANKLRKIDRDKDAATLETL